MSILEKMTFSQVQEKLAGVTYQDSINYYNQLKEKFLMQYKNTAQNIDDQIKEYYLQDTIFEINSNPVEGQEAIIEELGQEIVNLVIDRINGGNKDLANSLREKYKNKKLSGNKEFEQEASKLLSDEELGIMVMNILKNNSLTSQGFSAEDILNQMRSIRNKVIMANRRIRNMSIKSQVRSSKGYLREALVHKAFAELAKNLGLNISSTMLHSGNIKTSSGVDTAYDEFISFLGNVEGSFNLAISDEAPSLISSGFGIQVKSWKPPWETGTNAYYGYSVGSRTMLLSFATALYPTFSWTDGVIFLERYLKQAIGEQQVAYVTGSGFQWTASLISMFRERQYYYAFYFNSKHQATAHTGWQQINMKNISTFD